jgi:hypothetical protein
VQVFQDQEERLLGSQAQQEPQERVQGLLPLLLGRSLHRGIGGRQRQGQEGRQQRHGLRWRQVMLCQELLQVLHLLRGGRLGLQGEQTPGQQLGERIESSVLIVRRAGLSS